MPVVVEHVKSSKWANIKLPPLNLWSMPWRKDYVLRHGSMQDPNLWKDYD